LIQLIFCYCDTSESVSSVDVVAHSVRLVYVTCPSVLSVRVCQSCLLSVRYVSISTVCTCLSVLSAECTLRVCQSCLLSVHHVSVDEVRELWISPTVYAEDEPQYNLLDAIFMCIPNCKWRTCCYYYYELYRAYKFVKLESQSLLTAFVVLISNYWFFDQESSLFCCVHC